MGSFRERRLHIAAAAKAQLRGVGVAKRRRSNADGGLLSDVPSLVESVHPGQDAAAATFPSGILQVSFESLMKFRCHILVISKMQKSLLKLLVGLVVLSHGYCVLWLFLTGATTSLD